MHSAIRAFSGTDLASMARFIFAPYQVLPHMYLIPPVKCSREISGVPVLQFQPAHAESAQGSLGLLSCLTPREHSIVQEETGQGNDECCAQYVGRDANSRSLPSAGIQKPLFFVLHLLNSASAWADTPIICCRSRACSRVSRDPPRFTEPTGSAGLTGGGSALGAPEEILLLGLSEVSCSTSSILANLGGCRFILLEEGIQPVST